jgi:hypothetical protein
MFTAHEEPLQVGFDPLFQVREVAYAVARRSEGGLALAPEELEFLEMFLEEVLHDDDLGAGHLTSDLC